MRVRVPPKGTFTTYKLDKQLMFLDQENQIRGITPLVEGVILSIWEDTIMLPVMDTVFKEILDNKQEFWTEDQRGRVAEKYFIERIKQEQKLDVTVTKVNFLFKVDSWNKESIKWNGTAREYSGWKPPRASFKEKSYCFIPNSSNNPGADLFLWGHEERILWVFQVTVGPIKSHSNNFAKMMPKAGNQQELWRFRIVESLKKNIDERKEDTEVPEIVIKFIWVAPNRDVTKDHNGQYYLEFEDLDSVVFPLLYGFKK